MLRRAVTTREFEAKIDEILGPERGPNGEPSAHDFLNVVVGDLIAVLPERWDELLVDPGSGLRLAVASASVFGWPYVIWCRERDAETIELVDLEIDLS